MSKNKYIKSVPIDPAIAQKPSPFDYILMNQKFRVREDLITLKLAMISAENLSNYNRFLLHRIYREVLRDPIVSSQWESRKMKTKQKLFTFKTPAGEIDDEKTKLFQKSWFSTWIDYVLDSKLWGFSLIEFGPWDGKDFQPYAVEDSVKRKRIYDPISVVDRDYVKPELGIVANTYAQNTGVSFSDQEYKDYLMFIGKTHDFGLLYRLCKFYLMKDNATTNWSEWIEVFGMDKRVGFTKTQGNDRDKFVKAMRDLGNNSYAVFNETDRVEYIGSARSDAYAVYNEFIKYCDQGIEKLIWGQSVVTNNTGHVIGKVGESVADMYGDNDSKEVAELVNDTLIPFLENLGIKFNGSLFEWNSTEKMKQLEMADRDLKISQMGFKIDPEYIEKTYNVEVTEKQEPGSDIEPKVEDIYPANE